MHQRTRIDTRWGLQTGLVIGFVYALVALFGYWISPADYERHVTMNVLLMVICFVAGGTVVGLAMAGIRQAHTSRNIRAFLTFAAGIAFSASALAASHGSAYLARGSHWLVVMGIALAAPSIESAFWPDRG